MSQLSPPENFSSRVLTVLNLPVYERMQELSILFDRFTVRQIQDVYQIIVHSIFGINGNPLGWGLRTTTMDNSPHYFNTLQQFFGVSGVWMQMCHRLLNDTTKFDVDVSLLPGKFITMLQTGQNSMFYADIVNIDPFKRQVSTLSLNSFDFYIFHFALYALQPLHSINPIALQVHNERTKTVYQLLVAEYLSNFLPLYPDAVIEPVNFNGLVKSPQPLPTQLMQPQRKPRYIKVPTSYRNGNVGVPPGGNTSPQSSVNGTASRAHAWRSESVLHFFVDIWLRYDIEAEHHLPSSDFVRGVRMLIKQIHFFANAAQLDHSSLCSLRKSSLTMVKARIYAFLCSLIDRWPLDSSLVVVLELWLSYIQPWRYTLAIANNRQVINFEPPISNSFDGFIIDNLIVYTHIFMQLLPRFERLDYTVYRNAHMLYRLSKIFAQKDLVERLQKFERIHPGSTYGFDSPQRQVNLVNNSNNISFHVQWNPLVSTQIPKLFSEEMQKQIECFLYAISMARNSVLRDISKLRNEISERQRSEGFIKNLFNKLMRDCCQDEVTLREVSRIPELLRQGIDSFCRIFCVDPGNLSMHETLPPEQSTEATSTQQFSFNDSNNSLDISMLTPQQMSFNANNFQPAVDPALLPIKSNEIKHLVRFFHLISEFINGKYGNTIERCYSREDFIGKLSRQFFYAPMKELWFTNEHGNVDICEKNLPARLCLRPLGSIPVLSLLGFSMIMGYLWYGIPIAGLLSLTVLFVAYIALRALFS